MTGPFSVSSVSIIAETFLCEKPEKESKRRSKKVTNSFIFCLSGNKLFNVKKMQIIETRKRKNYYKWQSYFIFAEIYQSASCN